MCTATSSAAPIAVSTAAATIAAATTITTAATGAFFLRASRVNFHRSLGEIVIIEHGDSLLGLCLGAHFNKGEAFRHSGIAILDYGNGNDSASLSKQRPQIVVAD
jgi:hypothetical protein